MPDIITRQIVIPRGEREMVYEFTTFTSVFGDHDDTPAGKLLSYLAMAFTAELPDFSKAASISQMGEMFLPNLVHASGTDLNDLAMAANFIGKGRQQHPIVQDHFLRHDPHTVAYEVPVWTDDGMMRGSIDLLRILSPDRIQLPDFKPNARRERKAASQVFRYRDMLARRAHIPASAIEMCYFDERDTYFVHH